MKVATGIHTLLHKNVQGKVEKKQGLSYLSWAWAWTEALKADPNAHFNVHTFEGKPYQEINGTAMVWVTVTMFGKPLTCFLPVMNGANKPITLEGRKVQTRNGEIIEKIDSFNVNTAIMRCLTKGLGLHGLGLYIYAGEDLPEDGEKTPSSDPAPAAQAIPEAPQPTAQENADADLFRDAVMEYMKLSKTENDLRSYWKENQSRLDQLKVSHPSLYREILAEFKKASAQLKGEK